MTISSMFTIGLIFALICAAIGLLTLTYKIICEADEDPEPSEFDQAMGRRIEMLKRQSK